MSKTDTLTRVLAIAGALLVWVPLVAPVLFLAVFLVQARQFRFDFLMPAELFPIGTLGAVLLLWAGVRARSRVRLIAWGFGIAIALLVGAQAVAVVSGLASGAREPAGLWWVVALGSIAGYALAQVAVGIGALGLLRDVFGAPRSS